MLTFKNKNDLSRSAVKGGANLVYGLNSLGASALIKQWVSPPLHMSKAHQEDGFTISQLLSPTAGLLQGDLLEVEVSVQENTKAAVISPAACRIHSMDSGYAHIKQAYSVEKGGYLDVWTAPLILQSESKLKQETVLHVANGGCMLFCEIIAPGRSAFGERFAFDQWESNTRIYNNGTLINYENFTCEPQKGDVRDWQEAFPEGNYASMYLINDRDFNGFIAEMHQRETPDAVIGLSDLNRAGLGIKILAKDGVSLRKTIISLRERLFKELKLVIPPVLNRSQSFFFN
tara:strand:+ start:591 stop:1454 length:864 start_codon:yes stop_codon:yes gene_type:complete